MERRNFGCAPCLSLRRELAAGRRGVAALRMIACWIAYVRTEPSGLADPLAARLLVSQRTKDLLAFVAPDLAEDDAVVADLDELVARYRKGQ